MAAKGILVHSKRRSRSLSRTFEHAGYGVTWTGSASSCRDAIAARAVDLVLHDIDSSPSRELMACTNDARLPYLALTNSTETVLDLCRSPHIPNFVVADSEATSTTIAAHNSRSLGIAALDLIATVDKLERGQLFGLAAHLAPSTTSVFGVPVVYSMSARDRGVAGDAARQLRDPLRGHGVSAEAAAAIVCNAQRLLDAVRRGTEAGIIGDGRVELQTGVGAGTLAFGIRFGGLDHARIRALLRMLLGRSVWPDISGSDELCAIRSPLQGCRGIVVNIVHEHSTEVIGMVARRPSREQLRFSLPEPIPEPIPDSQHNSADSRARRPQKPRPLLQVFSGHQAMQQPSCVPTETVAISDSMRAQLRQSVAEKLEGGAVMRPLHGTHTQRHVRRSQPNQTSRPNRPRRATRG